MTNPEVPRFGQAAGVADNMAEWIVDLTTRVSSRMPLTYDLHAVQLSTSPCKHANPDLLSITAAWPNGTSETSHMRMSIMVQRFL